MIDTLELYNREEVIQACLESEKFTMALKVLKRHKMWTLAFKVALFGCEDLIEAATLCELSGDESCFTQLSEYAISSQNCEMAVKFALKAKSFANHQDLLSLLQLKQEYSSMLKCVEQFKANGMAVGPLYDKAFFICYLKLEMRNELKQFLASSSIGNVLLYFLPKISLIIIFLVRRDG